MFFSRSSIYCLVYTVVHYELTNLYLSLRDDYVAAIDGVQKHLARRTVPNGFLFIGELLGDGKDFKPKMDHLTCYLPGTLALGVHHGLPKSHLILADELMTTCYQTYAQQPTFLAPEITYFNVQVTNCFILYYNNSSGRELLLQKLICAIKTVTIKQYIFIVLKIESSTNAAEIVLKYS